MINKKDIVTLARDDVKVNELLKKSKSELEEMLGPDFAAMKDYDQNNPHHCYNLLEHTVSTATGIIKDNIDDDEFINLRVSSLFHDIGKPAVMTFDEKAGVNRYRHHAEKSAEIARTILDEAGFTPEEQRPILFYIENHDIFMYYKLPEEVKVGQPVISRDNVFKTISKVSDGGAAAVREFINLIILCIADAGAQSEAVYGKSGEIADSRELKIRRMTEIRNTLEELIDEQKTGQKY